MYVYYFLKEMTIDIIKDLAVQISMTYMKVYIFNYSLFHFIASLWRPLQDQTKFVDLTKTVEEPVLCRT